MGNESIPAPVPPPPDLVEGDQKFVSMLGQFFLIPLLIAVVGVAIFVGIRTMTAQEKDPVRLVTEIRLQHGASRWQTAYDLNARLLRDPKARKDPRLVPELTRAFTEIQPATEDDRRTRTYIVMILGTLKDSAAMPVLLPAMRDKDGAVQVAAIQAVGSVGDPVVLPDLFALAADDDPGLRKAAVFALGLFAPRRRQAEGLTALAADLTAKTHETVRLAHRDRVEDVRWNAALAMARFGDAESAPTLRSMMDREYLRRIAAAPGTEMSTDMMSEVVVNAMKGAVELQDAAFRPRFEEISKSDPSMEVREAARALLAALPPSAESAGKN
jgi:HEAT repeat protein